MTTTEALELAIAQLNDRHEADAVTMKYINLKPELEHLVDRKIATRFRLFSEAIRVLTDLKRNHENAIST